jgi:hypothetical protein
LDGQLGVGLVAANCIEGVGNGTGAAVQLAEVVGNFVNNRLGNGDAVNARR